METYQERAKQVVEQVGQIILGKHRQIQEVLLTLLVGGHILLEDIPGVGKTRMALAFSKAMGLHGRRVQFTPDVLPSDLTGFSIYRRDKEEFIYQEGAVFCNLLLADEINRTSPKTQAALLEVMEERQCTVEGVTREVPKPFLVIATQNPYGNAGTQRLPEAQTDRFMITLSMGYPDFESELQMAKMVGGENQLEAIQPLLTREDFWNIQQEIEQVYIKETVYRYLLSLVTATRTHPQIERGASPRATIALVKMARASAWYAGRNYVLPRDVKEQFPYVIPHRLQTSFGVEAGTENRKELTQEILQQVQEPSMGEENR